tara:strand:+ start:199 stop:399 length:201 start_codon:yes stop_codon:yes gene_type:complete
MARSLLTPELNTVPERLIISPEVCALDQSSSFSDSDKFLLHPISKNKENKQRNLKKFIIISLISHR